MNAKVQTDSNTMSKAIPGLSIYAKPRTYMIKSNLEMSKKLKVIKEYIKKN